ncbi:siderophore-interacting protein [Aliivibrio finisterrensis]|uniref:siderophore-interacting protein n=1 Tax=Aliivibrio finisterrensis TaxID=511998 RepID=UPI0010224C7A|nr:siderophore-interacting protein [Aliivibrio finisterrensis]RYU70509.1 siderophore-interacting protein [Aliivibrio finisterrensis]RYU74370.1 siderophore-interacting protein [Aliivibrio finisterrensis]RYU76976.1 siderophore-interacting protein [Aliivibrio finisterrensis]
MNKKPSPRVLTVVNNLQLTANMQRITFKADDLSDFTMETEGGYIKLLFNENGGTELSEIAEGTRPMMRTYTVRNLRKEQNELDVDFVRHHHENTVMSAETGGFASAWSQNAVNGDTISIAGPGSIKGLNHNADWFFLVADMTALPALSAKLEALPATEVGYAVIEINHQSDKQTLTKPQGLELVWVIKSDAQDLTDTVRAQEWKVGRVSVWCACEFNQMRTLRTYFRNEKEVDKDDLYISSYWKQGCTEDGHKVAKHEDQLAEG